MHNSCFFMLGNRAKDTRSGNWAPAIWLGVSISAAENAGSVADWDDYLDSMDTPGV